MKNTNICPQCQETEIARIEALGNFGVDTIQCGIVKKAFITKYVCLKCGFIEQWLEQKDLDKIRKAYISK